MEPANITEHRQRSCSRCRAKRGRSSSGGACRRKDMPVRKPALPPESIPRSKHLFASPRYSGSADGEGEGETQAQGPRSEHQSQAPLLLPMREAAIQKHEAAVAHPDAAVAAMQGASEAEPVPFVGKPSMPHHEAAVAAMERSTRGQGRSLLPLRTLSRLRTPHWRTLSCCSLRRLPRYWSSRTTSGWKDPQISKPRCRPRLRISTGRNRSGIRCS